MKEVLGIPKISILITLIGIGKKSEDLSMLDEKHQKQETEQRERKDFSEIDFMDHYP